MIRGTLMPTRGGRHVLHLNGGMRAATGVGVEDTVTIKLRGVTDEVVVPADITAGLAAVPGAAEVFAALLPSRRRELLRFVDDARSAATRARRIRQTAAHVVGQPEAERSAGQVDRPIWTCPRCGHQFSTPNQYHSCQVHSLDDAFRGKPPEIRRLFDAFRALVEACGPVTVVPYRDRVGFMVRVRFAGATPRQRWLDVSFWLTCRAESERFTRVETLAPNTHIHMLRVTGSDHLDAKVRGSIAAKRMPSAARSTCGAQPHRGDEGNEREAMKERAPADQGTRAPQMS